MPKNHWMDRKPMRPRTAVTAAALAALMIGGTGFALAGSDATRPSTTLNPAATAAQSPAALAPLTGFADIVDSVRPAVVNIEVVREAGLRPRADEDERYHEFFERFFDERGEGHGEGPGAREGEEMGEYLERWFREFQGRRHEGDQQHRGRRHGARCRSTRRVPRAGPSASAPACWRCSS